MTKIGRKTACVVTFLFAAGCAVASATRFVGIAGPADQPPSDSSVSVVTTGSRTETRAKTTHDRTQRDAGLARLILLHGKVLGPGDRPITGARLYLSVDEWTDPIELGTGDASGAYRFVIREEKLRRTVSPNFVYAECKAALLPSPRVLARAGQNWRPLKAVAWGI